AVVGKRQQLQIFSPALKQRGAFCMRSAQASLPAVPMVSRGSAFGFFDSLSISTIWQARRPAATWRASALDPRKLAFRKLAYVPNYKRSPMITTDTKVQITDHLIQDCIVRAVQSVFKTMMGQEAVFVAQVEAEPTTIPLTASQIIGSVGFIGGANGLIYLCLSEEFAKIASSRILGMTAAEVEMHGSEVVHDAIGEITNMTVGGFKNTLCD